MRTRAESEHREHRRKDVIKQVPRHPNEPEYVPSNENVKSAPSKPQNLRMKQRTYFDFTEIKGDLFVCGHQRQTRYGQGFAAKRGNVYLRKRRQGELALKGWLPAIPRECVMQGQDY